MENIVSNSKIILTYIAHQWTIKMGKGLANNVESTWYGKFSVNYAFRSANSIWPVILVASNSYLSSSAAKRFGSWSRGIDERHIIIRWVLPFAVIWCFGYAGMICFLNVWIVLSFRSFNGVSICSFCTRFGSCIYPSYTNAGCNLYKMYQRDVNLYR